LIPKRALFYWEGEPMSWLRKQSIESFRVLNPGWEISLIGDLDLPIEPSSMLSIAHRSDWGRYRALHQRGGVYFDTDIIFTRPVPEEWLTHEMVMSGNHVACMGCEAGEPWFRLLDAACEDLHRRGTRLAYQGMGRNLLLKFIQNVQGRDTFWMDDDALIPVPWNETERLWNGVSSIPDASLRVGVHWFGGDLLSQDMESQATERWAESADCLVARAWRSTFATGDKEAHREQHGL
jgi:hypothetical protein